MMTEARDFATPEMLAALAAPTPPEEVGILEGRMSNKTGKRSPDMDYVTARFVQGRFDSTVGPALWQNSYERHPNGRLVAGIGVLCVSGWVWKYDTGDESDIEPGKGEFSDSFKRAAVLWGVARDLYPGPKRVRSTQTPSFTTVEQVHETEQQVVGQRGLTDPQRNLLFGKLKEAGVTGDQRKALVFLTVQKHSVKDMNGEDLDRVLAVLDAPRSENQDIWENVELVNG